MAIDATLQAQVDSLLNPFPEAGERDTAFAPFSEAHQEHAAQLTEELAQVADEQGLQAALDLAGTGMGDALPGAVKQAVSALVTHHPAARGTVSMPSVEAVPLAAAAAGAPAAGAPAAAAPAAAAPAKPADAVIPVPNPETLPAGEQGLDWYREDPLANDHHGHWHKVYPGKGFLGKTQPRQGELFFYMHQQMLARYATERLIAGLPPLVPFAPLDGPGGESYTAEIPEGYGLPDYTARGAGKKLHDLKTAEGDLRDLAVQRIADVHRAVDLAILSGQIGLAAGGTLPLTESFLGAAVESSTPRAADDSGPLPFDPTVAGNFHGLGHVMVSEMLHPDSTDKFFGPMAYFETAISDPFFYRWHGHIDDLYAQFQVNAGPNTYDEFAADVRFRNEGDIALVLSRDIPGSDAHGFDFAAWGAQAFGSGMDTIGAPATDELLTRFQPSRAIVTSPGGSTTTLVDNADLLTHEPFVVFLRIENKAAAKQDVTVRLFLAHADLARERRRWIELDKFKATLAPGVNVVAQPDARSSVIKRKGVTAPGAEPPHDGTSTWCDCGWPYSLLIPSGASDASGTPFHLMAAVTAWEKDHANAADTCTSMSFCGSETFYPDTRNMGYPFDREFAAGVLPTIAAHASMTVRDLTIRCENARPT